MGYDTRFDELWGMHNTGQTDGTVNADINAPEAWDIATSSEIIYLLKLLDLASGHIH